MTTSMDGLRITNRLSDPLPVEGAAVEVGTRYLEAGRCHARFRCGSRDHIIGFRAEVVGS